MTTVIVVIVAVVVVVGSIVIGKFTDLLFRPAERLIDEKVDAVLSRRAEKRDPQRRPVAGGPASFTRLGVEVTSSSGGQVVVRQIPFGSAGDKLGLQPGDIIWRVNGQEIHDARALDSAVSAASGYSSRVDPGTLALVVVRNGSSYTLALR